MKLKKPLLVTMLMVGSIVALPDFSFSQIKIIQFEQIDSLQRIEKRNVAVFIHTDWCKYCQTMQNTTFKNDSIIKVLNNKFYFIDLNAEEKRNVIFNKSRTSGIVNCD